MKRVDPKEYLERIAHKFDIENMYELDEELVNQQPREYDRRVEIAKLFVPEIEKAVPYDVRYDIAATIVLLLVPLDQRLKILEYLSEHYKIPVFYPYNIECHKDVYSSKSGTYHPALLAAFFSFMSMPENRLKDFSELLYSIRCSQGPLSFDQFVKILNYYAWKTEFKISAMEIDILNTILPHYPRTIEELNYTLQNIYNQSIKAPQSPKFMKELTQKMDRDYKTVKKHLELLKSKPSRTSLWVDMHFFDLEPVHIVIPADRKVQVKSIYQTSTYNTLNSGKSETHMTFTVPKNYLQSFVKKIGETLKKDYKIYAVSTIPLINYDFRFLNDKKNSFVINWDEVETHFGTCNFQPYEGEYIPIHPKKGNIDALMLKMHEYLIRNANISNIYLQEALHTTPQNISVRKRELQNVGLVFPYVYSLNCPEVYLLRINTKLATLNYIIQLLTIFPCVYYFSYENIIQKNDKFLSAWIHLPTGNYKFFRSLTKIKLPDYDLSYIQNQNYQMGFRLWEMFDDKKGDYNYNLDGIQIITD